MRTPEEHVLNICYGTALRLAREAKGWSQSAFAVQMRWPQSFVSRQESGQRTVTRRESDQINALLDVDVDVWAVAIAIAQRTETLLERLDTTVGEAYTKAGHEAMVGLVLFVARTP